MHYRRGSPLLIGVKSRNKLSTDHIPVLYSKGVYNQQLLNSDIIIRKVENCGMNFNVYKGPSIKMVTLLH